MFWPMFIVAVAAAIIASQAMISAVFSIVEQSLALGCFPTVKVVHTSSKLSGQVYIPEVNWILMILCVVVTGIFKTTAYIGNAYGIAVMAVMLVTTTLVTLIMVMIWHTRIFLALVFFLIFGIIEVIYFTANLYKFTQGGWLPVAFSGILLVIMSVWHYVSSKKYEFEANNKVSIASLANRVEHELQLSRVPGIGLIYSPLVQGIPHIFDLVVDNMKALHSVVVFVSVKHLPIAFLPDKERFLVRRVGRKEYRMYQSVVRYGYMDSMIPHQHFEDLLMGKLEEFLKIEALQCEMPPVKEQLQSSNEDESDCQYSDKPRPSKGKKRPRGSNKEIMRVTSSSSYQIKENLQKELEFLSKARKEGVTYILGNSAVEASPTSSFAQRFLVNGVYSVLQRLSRNTKLALQIPHNRLVEVGITYTL